MGEKTRTIKAVHASVWGSNIAARAHSRERHEGGLALASLSDRVEKKPQCCGGVILPT